MAFRSMLGQENGKSFALPDERCVIFKINLELGRRPISKSLPNRLD